MIVAVVCFILALACLSSGALYWLSLRGIDGGFGALVNFMALGWGYIYCLLLGCGFLALAAIKVRVARWCLLATLPFLVLAAWLGFDGLQLTLPEDRKATVDEVPSLLKSLQTKNREKWEESVYRLASVGEEAVPALREALDSSDPNVRRGAASALRELVNSAPNALPVLIDSLSATDDEVRAISATALKEYVIETKNLLPALPALSKGLGDENRTVRLACARTLCGIAEERPEAVVQSIPLMIKSLEGPDQGVNGVVAKTLGYIGPKARSALVALDGLARKGEDKDAFEAAEALWRIGGKETKGVAHAIRFLEHKHEDFRVAASRLLGRMGSDASDAIPALELVAKSDPSPQVRSEAQAALARIRSAKREADK